MNVDVAVIPAAGRGTRMRPATNAIPKALLTVVDRPSIQWVVEEAVRAGVGEVIVVVDPDTGGMIERHFADLPGTRGATVRSVVQNQARGLGDAVLRSREAVGDRPFFVLTADDLIRPRESILHRLASSSGDGHSVVCVRELPIDVLSSKGVIAPRSDIKGDVVGVGAAVEKPTPAEAPSRLCIQGRYLFMPEVFEKLADVGPGYGGEIQLTDAIDALAGEGRCRAYVTDVEILDVGNPSGFLNANFVLAAASREYGGSLKAIMRRLLEE